MSKVVMLLSNPFRPDVRVHKEAKTLVEEGHEVEILAWDRECTYPKEEVRNGIRISRYRRKARSGDFLSITFNLFFFHFFAFWKIVKSDVDIVHCHDLDTLAPGLLAGKLKCRRVMYDAHELYPEMVADTAPSSFVGLLKRLDSYLTRRVDAVICVSEALSKPFRENRAKKVEVVMNCPELVPVDTEKVKALRRELDPQGDKTIVLYIGVLEPQRMLEELVEAFSSIEKDYLLVIGGFGTLEDKIGSSTSGSVLFLGKVDQQDSIVYNNAADVLVAIYNPRNRNNRLGTPNKLFEAMATGKPIIVARGSHAGEIVEKEMCGFTVSYGSRKEMLNILEELRQNKELHDEISRNGLNAANSNYNWTIMKARLVKLYKTLRP